MGKWVSVYLTRSELEKLEKIRERIEKSRGRRISYYEIIREWVLEKLKNEC